MELQPILYRGRLVAAGGPERFFLSPTLDRRPAGDPECTFVCFMCFYAGEVIRGELPGPYSDQHAVAFARAALIPERLIEAEALDVERVAQAFGIPSRELIAARREH